MTGNGSSYPKYTKLQFFVESMVYTAEVLAETYNSGSENRAWDIAVKNGCRKRELYGKGIRTKIQRGQATVFSSEKPSVNDQKVCPKHGG